MLFCIYVADGLNSVPNREQSENIHLNDYIHKVTAVFEAEPLFTDFHRSFIVPSVSFD